jgi:hypothetical protein
MYRHLWNLRNRVERLEQKTGATEVRFLLGDGVRSGIKRRELLDALSEAINGQDTFRARVLLNARGASDGNKLFELAQALHAGPVERNTAEGA